ncbi:MULTISPECIES: hypothetical protein [Bacillus]|nr:MULTISPECIES: hypothetical protein [Bacillus]MDZ5669073.1 hypothetical protein [Bacillus stercoris]WGE37979.1 hypothetical protein QA442_16280 [Bacillus stercoris]
MINSCLLYVPLVRAFLIFHISKRTFSCTKKTDFRKEIGLL